MPHNRTVFTQSDIESFNWLKFNGQNGEVLYALSGIIPVKMKGNSESWIKLDITCSTEIPELPDGKGFCVHYYTPFAALNSIFNEQKAVNGGHAVNSFDLVSLYPNGRNYGSPVITLALKLAVCDADAILYRVGFNVILAGVYLPLAPLLPIP